MEAVRPVGRTAVSRKEPENSGESRGKSFWLEPVARAPRRRTAAMKTITANATCFGFRRNGLIATTAIALMVALVASVKAVPQAPLRAPQRLLETGLYSDFTTLQVDQ